MFFCTGKTLLDFSATSRSVSTAYFFTTIGTLIGIVSASLGLVCSFDNELINDISITTRRKHVKHKKIVILAKGSYAVSKNIISKEVEDSSNEEFVLKENGMNFRNQMIYFKKEKPCWI